jgi:hypothetical protein
MNARAYAVFRIGARGKDDWTVCVLWVDDGKGVRSCYQLDREAEMSRLKYGISGKGEPRWTLGVRVMRDHDAHITLLPR